MAKINYASPAWWGFTSGDDRGRLEAFYRRCARFGYCNNNTQRERESLFATKYKKNIQNHTNITIMAGYQIGKPIKLVAYSTNYINS